MDKFPYRLGESYLEYVTVEKDLGVKITPRLCWNQQWQSIVSSASSRLGLTKRTCHFVKDKKKRLILYKTMVRSLFQHCAEIWRPCTKTALDKFKAIQKRAVKWICMEESEHYSETVYQSKLQELDLLPIELRFQYGDLKLFYRIINGEVCIKLPDYLELISPEEITDSRLRQTHKDPLYFVCNIIDRVNVFRNNFFYRAHTLWNRLPLNIRLIQETKMFDKELNNYLMESSRLETGD